MVFSKSGISGGKGDAMNEQEAGVEAWVKRLNALSRDIDSVYATSHPATCQEQTKTNTDKWKALAASEAKP